MTNELIAVSVMGWEKDCSPPTHVWWNVVTSRGVVVKSLGTLPDFLTDMTAAMMVVEKMREKGFMFDCGTSKENRYYADFHTPGCVEKGFDDCESLPTAICHAALSALNIPH